MEFTVPMIGKEVGYGVDAATRNEQNRFYNNALKPSKLRTHVGPMLNEVEVSSLRLMSVSSHISMFIIHYLML
jgi:hypothetical protein